MGQKDCPDKDHFWGLVLSPHFGRLRDGLNGTPRQAVRFVGRTHLPSRERLLPVGGSKSRKGAGRPLQSLGSTFDEPGRRRRRIKYIPISPVPVSAKDSGSGVFWVGLSATAKLEVVDVKVLVTLLSANLK